MFLCICIAAIFVIPVVGIILHNTRDYDHDGSIYGKMGDEDNRWKFF